MVMNMNRILRALLMVTLSMALAMGMWVGMPAQRVAAETTTIVYWPSSIPADSSTPFSVFVSFIEGTPDTDYYVTVYVYGSAAYGNSNSQAYNWRSDISEWKYAGSTTTDRITVKTDGDGNWSGWVHVRVNTPSTYTTASLRARIRPVAINESFDDTKTVDLLDMTGGATNPGGWLEESQGDARAGRAVVVKDGTDIVGMYVAEDNSIVEGYTSDAGYYKVAGPSCTSCGYTLETWDLSAPGTVVDKVNTMGQESCPADIAAGSTTSLDSCTTPTTVTFSGLNATSPFVALAMALVASTGLVILRKRK